MAFIRVLKDMYSRVLKEELEQAKFTVNKRSISGTDFINLGKPNSVFEGAVKIPDFHNIAVKEANEWVLDIRDMIRYGDISPSNFRRR